MAPTRTIEVSISPTEALRVEGLQRDRRRRSDLKITLPDGGVVLAHGRRPTEPGWEVYFPDESDVVVGLALGYSVAVLMGWHVARDDEPEWLDRFNDALSWEDRPSLSGRKATRRK